MPSADPIVDVIIAVHDPRRPIRRAVASVLDHTRASIRVIVVVHNIEPAPIQAALADFLFDKRLQIVSFVDGIASPAGPMNRGLELSTAEFSSLLGSDDEFAPGAIDYWLAIQQQYDASAVIARIDTATGKIVPQPPVRYFNRGVLDAVRDRLAYRSAPLGLISMKEFGHLRLTVGLASGEDLTYTLQIWFSGKPIVFARASRGYILHTDGPARVTTTARTAREEFLFVKEILPAPWFNGLSQKQQIAISVKLLRVQVMSSIVLRVDAGIETNDRQTILENVDAIIAMTPQVRNYLSLRERLLLRLLENDSTIATVRLKRVAKKWKKKFSPGAVITLNPFVFCGTQAPFRYGVASLLLQRFGK